MKYAILFFFISKLTFFENLSYLFYKNPFSLPLFFFVTKLLFYNNNMQKDNQENKLLPADLQSLKDQQLTQYLKKFLEIKAYKEIKQGRQLLTLFRNCVNDHQSQKTVKKIFIFYRQVPPQGKVCALQFFKELIQNCNINVFLEIEKQFIDIFVTVCSYRSQNKHIERGSSYFLKNQNIHQTSDKFNDLLKLSNTYFRMVHEMLYVWGSIYFPHTKFAVIYKKLSKQCTFPSYPGQFKFYNENKVEKKLKQFDQLNNQLYKLKSKTQKLSNDESILKKGSPNESEYEKSGQQKKQLQEVDDDELINKLSLQNSQISKIIKPSKKMNNAKKIQPNVIYRESSVQDPEDLTEEIIKLVKLKKEADPNMPPKNIHIQIPMGIINEVSNENSKNNNQIPSKSSINSTVKNKSSKGQSLNSKSPGSSSLNSQNEQHEKIENNIKQIQTIKAVFNEKKLEQKNRKQQTVEIEQIDLNNFIIEVNEPKPDKIEHKSEIQEIREPISSVSKQSYGYEQPQSITFSQILKKQKENLAKINVENINKPIIQQSENIIKQGQKDQVKSIQNISETSSQKVKKSKKFKKIGRFSQKNENISTKEPKNTFKQIRHQNINQKPKQIAKNFRKFKEYSLTIIPQKSIECSFNHQKNNQQIINENKQRKKEVQKLFYQLSQQMKAMKSDLEKGNKEALIKIKKQMQENEKNIQKILKAQNRNITQEQLQKQKNLTLAQDSSLSVEPIQPKITKKQENNSQKNKVVKPQNSVSSISQKNKEPSFFQKQILYNTHQKSRLFDQIDSKSSQLGKIRSKSNSMKKSAMKKRNLPENFNQFPEGTMLHILASKRRKSILF